MKHYWVRFQKLITPSLRLGLFSLLVSGCGEGNVEQALGTLERDTIRLTSPVSEIITQVFVDEGDQVSIGTPLLQLDDTAAQAQLAGAAASLQRARAQLLQLQNGALAEELASAKARVENAQATAVAARKAYSRTQTLVSEKLLQQAELDNAVARKDSANAVLKDAEEQYALLLKGTRTEQLDQAKAVVEEAQQSFISAKKYTDDLKIVATRAGVVDSLPWEQGERVNNGAVVAVLLAAGNPYVRAYMPESARTDLHVGKTFTVLLNGVDEKFTGTLVHVHKDPAFSPHYALTESERSRLMYLVKIQLDDNAANLPSGIPAQVELAGGSDGE